MPEAEQGNQTTTSAASGEKAKDAVATGKKETPGKAHPKKHKKAKKRGPWVLMAVIAAALLAIWFFAPAEIRQDISGLLTQTKPQREAEAPKVVAPAAPIPSMVTATAPPLLPPTVSSEEVEALRGTIDELKDSLRELRDESAALRQAMGKRQLPDIRVRLNWIANPASTLDQVYFAWSDIAVAAGFDDEQRLQAEQMRDIAARHWQTRREWVSALEAVAEALRRSADERAGESGEATLQASFMKWVKDNFHLSRSDVEDRMAAAELENRVAQAIKAIKSEHWPQPEPWQQLLNAIHETGHQPSGLPDDFTSITSDVDVLRSKARAWLEQL